MANEKKGKGKGKGKNKDKTNGKGKGKGEQTDYKPESYFYDDHPHRARGLKVIKCANPICFGCVLQGKNTTTTTCRYCQWVFRIPSSAPDDITPPWKQDTKAPANKQPSSRSSSLGRKDTSSPNEKYASAETMHKQLVDEDGFTAEKATAFVLKHLGVQYPKPDTVKPTALTHELEKFTAEINKVENHIRRQQDRQSVLLHQCQECEDQITLLNETRVELLAKKDAALSKLGTLFAKDQQAVHLAQGLGDDSNAHLHSLKNHIQASQIDSLTADLVYKDVCGIILAAQNQIKGTTETSRNEIRSRDNSINEMKTQLAELKKQINDIAKPAVLATAIPAAAKAAGVSSATPAIAKAAGVASAIPAIAKAAGVSSSSTAASSKAAPTAPPETQFVLSQSQIEAIEREEQEARDAGVTFGLDDELDEKKDVVITDSTKSAAAPHPEAANAKRIRGLAATNPRHVPKSGPPPLPALAVPSQFQAIAPTEEEEE
jgi:hypothetical protein